MIDILIDNTSNDLLIAGGDFETGDTTEQEVATIITSYQGWFKQFPLIGCGAPSYLNSPGDCEQLRRQIQIQLKGDGKQLSSFDYEFDADGNLIINVNGQIITI